MLNAFKLIDKILLSKFIETLSVINLNDKLQFNFQVNPRIDGLISVRLVLKVFQGLKYGCSRIF